ncbi:AbrB/MazE/SpoVT family DNA-binding domain-containing protein [Sporolactobacillus nakayamae]|uniref:Looped-hinge helix DNA binding domain-containing protein, AbrB family n=1 Tax=Sporolactobacillus nakayamae TaxID=269670 RepID=A0A1I2VLH2_9BACL|nr:AbrB/MazE/SpoVT family DNA-binding domain-containing protein [Sporolactobacillus nakayamae]SFG90174.1 looped-hinge helix DNA binding domain-containing protein, AbrB family [Sporolactobacillus nakayamae]
MAEATLNHVNGGVSTVETEHSDEKIIAKSVLKKKGQLTIPKEVRKMLDLKENDELEFSVAGGKIILRPVITIAKDQMWFWTKEWQEAEREADSDIEHGHVHSFTDVDDAIKFLKSE